MTAESIVNLTIPFLKLTDTVKTALDLFNLHKLTYLPVVEDKSFLGLISDIELLEEAGNRKINTFTLIKIDAFVHEGQHILEIFRLMNLHETSLISVLNSSSEYIGCISHADIVNYLSTLSYIKAPGGIIVLSVDHNQYSLAEISRIVESNDMKILGAYVTDNPENGFETFVTIKINKTDLTRLIASFERYSYKIVADFHESAFQNYDAERLELLFKYLNI